MSASRNDFCVLQTYDELGEACYHAVVDALLKGDEWDPAPTAAEVQWAEGIAKDAKATFLNGLDEA